MQPARRLCIFAAYTQPGAQVKTPEKRIHGKHRAGEFREREKRKKPVHHLLRTRANAIAVVKPHLRRCLNSLFVSNNGARRTPVLPNLNLLAFARMWHKRGGSHYMCLIITTARHASYLRRFSPCSADFLHLFRAGTQTFCTLFEWVVREVKITVGAVFAGCISALCP